jgi:hypothetical protein
MAAPTFVAETETVFNTTTTPKTLSITTQTGDVIVAVGMGSNWANSGSDLTISGGGLTWTQQQANDQNSYSQHHVWTATATANTTFNISVSNPAAGTDFGFSYTQWRGSAGIGASNKAFNPNGIPTVGLTTTQADSAIVWSNTDWVPVDGATRAYLSINGSGPTERTYFFDGGIGTFYVATYANAGTAAAKTAGLSTPGGQKYVNIAVEVLGTASGPQDVLPSSIASAEAFGTATISAANDIVPTGIGSAEAFGTAAIAAANEILPGSITSAETFGTAAISTTADIAPGGIASGEAFGTAVISATNEILPSGIPSAEAFGNAVVALQGTQIVAPSSIGSGEAFGTAALSTTADVAPTGIGSAEAFGTPTILAESAIAPAGIGSGEAFGLPIVSPGAVTISPPSIASAEAFGTPTVTDSSLGQIIAPIGIPSGEAFGTPYVWMHIVRACDCSVLVDD